MFGRKKRRRRHVFPEESQRAICAYVTRLKPTHHNGVKLPERPCPRIDDIHHREYGLELTVAQWGGGGWYRAVGCYQDNKREYVGTHVFYVEGEPLIDGEPILPKQPPVKHVSTRAAGSSHERSAERAGAAGGKMEQRRPEYSPAVKKLRGLLWTETEKTRLRAHELKDHEKCVWLLHELSDIIKILGTEDDARTTQMTIDLVKDLRLLTYGGWAG